MKRKLNISLNQTKLLSFNVLSVHLHLFVCNIVAYVDNKWLSNYLFSILWGYTFAKMLN